MNPTARTTDIDIMDFAILAIGVTAKKMGNFDTEVHNRLKRFRLIQSWLLDCYDTLHTESIDGVVWNVMEALKNWEQKVEKH